MEMGVVTPLHTMIADDRGTFGSSICQASKQRFEHISDIFGYISKIFLELVKCLVKLSDKIKLQFKVLQKDYQRKTKSLGASAPSLSRDPMASRDAYQKLCGLIADPGSSMQGDRGKPTACFTWPL